MRGQQVHGDDNEFGARATVIDDEQCRHERKNIRFHLIRSVKEIIFIYYELELKPCD